MKLEAPGEDREENSGIASKGEIVREIFALKTRLRSVRVKNRLEEDTLHLETTSGQIDEIEQKDRKKRRSNRSNLNERITTLCLDLLVNLIILFLRLPNVKV